MILKLNIQQFSRQYITRLHMKFNKSVTCCLEGAPTNEAHLLKAYNVFLTGCDARKLLVPDYKYTSLCPHKGFIHYSMWNKALNF